MTAKGTLTAIIELEELKKDTATTRNVLLSAQKVLALATNEAGNEHVMQLMTAMRDKFSSMIESVQHYRSTQSRRKKTVGLVPCFFHWGGPCTL